MFNLKYPKNITDPLMTGGEADSINNLRVATRFIREDIAASVEVFNLLGFSKTIAVDLLDITSKGVLVASDQKLGINKKIVLTLRFKSGEEFIINATVARRSDSPGNEYGIKFDAFNHELGDYLLETQEKLVFK